MIDISKKKIDDFQYNGQKREEQKQSSSSELNDILNISNNIKSKLIEKMLKQVYQYNTLSKDEEIQIISQLESLDLEKDWFSKWSEWAVFKVEIKDINWKPKEYLVAKKRYDNNPINERHIHNRIQNVLKNSNVDTNIVRVPELKAVLNVEDDNFIIMEFVKGKTFYQIQIEKILEKRWVPVGTIDSDTEAESMLFKLLKLNSLNPEDREKASNFYYKESKYVKLFTPEQWKMYKDALGNFLKVIHKEWLYHRDWSNPRNIILWDNGALYIIDFWRSVDIKWTNVTEKQIYEKQEWELTWFYPRDEEILLEINQLTKTISDLECEKETLEIRQKIKKIESSDSVFSLLKSIPESWIKNKKQRDEVLKKTILIWNDSKRVRLIDLKEIKTNKEIVVLLLTQSYDNIDFLLTEIIEEKWRLYKAQELEKNKSNQVPGYVLRLWKKSVDEHKLKHNKAIENIDKKIFFFDNIEKKLIELKHLINKK